MYSILPNCHRFWILRVGVLTLSVNGCPRRTNNNVESFHKSLQLKFSVSHPNLWVFLEQLSHLSENYHIVVDQLSNGLQPTKKLSVKFLANSARIRRATEEYDSHLITLRQFLERCSYSMAAYEMRQRHWALGVQNGMNKNSHLTYIIIYKTKIREIDQVENNEEVNEDDAVEQENIVAREVDEIGEIENENDAVEVIL
eukprot:XP_016660717.1 PREDICTED: uncharacterized protein LOC107884004 [Acyrthosiphon pisum]